MPDPQREIALDTYRYLRVGMPLIVLGLAAAILIQASPAHCFKTSISAYYYAPVHSIFIAALCALGALLTIYKGVCDSEDALLSLAGVLALFVAMVPTPRKMLRPGEITCGNYDLPDDYSVAHGVTNNVLAVIITLVAVQAFTLWMYYRTTKAGDQTTNGPSCGGVLIRAFLWAIIGVIALNFRSSQFLAHGHYVAAVTMFAAIILTVSITAFVSGRQAEELSPHKRLYRRTYWVIAGAMTLTVLLAWGSHKMLPHWIMFVEAALILEFAIYWIIQTIELWNTQNRIALLPDEDRDLLLERGIVRRRHPLELGITREIAPDEKPGKAEKMLRLL